MPVALVIHLPAQTMVERDGWPAAVLTMGTHYEAALLLLAIC